MTTKNKSISRHKHKAKDIQSVRCHAASLLAKWFSNPVGKRPPFDEFLNSFLDTVELKAADQALFREIVFGAIRWFRLLEWHLKRHIHKFAKLHWPIKAVLLTGAYQIIFLSRIPFFSAVDESVKAVKVLGFSWAKGIVNAVLRKISTGTKIIPKEEEFFRQKCKKNFLNCVSNFSSHPHWMVKRWEAQWGEDTCLSICVNNNIRAPLSLRVNMLKVKDIDEAISLLNSKGINPEKGILSSQCLIIENFRGNPYDLPGFSDGFFQVQDESSQLISMMLSPSPGDHILDACAGVGGKASHIASLIQDSGTVVSTDICKTRLDLLKANADRLGIKNIQPILLTGNDIKKIAELGPFDRILVDAPCSGLGIIRRHPDIKWNRTPQMIKALKEKQIEILVRTAPLLKDKGLLVYSVCTIEKEETLEVVKEFLKKYKEFEIMNPAKLLPRKALPLLAGQGFLRIFPGQMGMDGFFAVAFKKRH